MATTNQTFSIKRFGLLFKREFILRKQFLLFALLGMPATIFVFISLTLWAKYNFKSWDQTGYTIIFWIFMTVYWFIYSGNSFRYFRNNKRTLDYILIPNSSTEKYLFEVITRIVLFSIIFPIVFWIAANLAGILVNAIVSPEYILTYNFWSPIEHINLKIASTEGKLLMFSTIVCWISTLFAGGAFFIKRPIQKTILTMIAYTIGLFTYNWILRLIFGMNLISSKSTDITKEDGFLILFGLTILTTCVIHAATFMRLKEKEV